MPAIIGESATLRHTMQSVQRAAGSDTTVLLEGESGTGKELFARALHALSERANGPFIAINCAAIPDSLLEAELFGYEKGAFTGAAQRKPGRFELAQRGTLFLDEVGELPLALQAKLLRAIETKRFERLGGTSTIQVDVRHRRRHQSRPSTGGGGPAVPRRPLLPALGVSGDDSAPARAPGGHPAAGAALRRAHLRRVGSQDAEPQRPRARGAHGLRLARQRAGAAELRSSAP